MYLSQTELPTKKVTPVQETPFLQPAAEGFFLQYTLPEPICEPPNELQKPGGTKGYAPGADLL